MSAMTSPSPPSNALVEHISAHAGSLPSDRRLRPYFLNSASLRSGSGPPAQKVHLSILPRRPKAPACGNCGAQRAGVEAVAAADAQVLVVQHYAVLGLEEAVNRAHRHARRIRAVHAGHRDRFLGADDAVVDGHHAAAVYAPRHFVLLLACGDAAVALDAALGVAQEFHSRHGCLLKPGTSPLGKASSWFPASASPGHSRRSSRC